MQAPDHRLIRRSSHRRHQAGATVVEFALIVIVFLTFIFAIIELARIMFLFNTLQEVTRRAATAAAVSDLGSAAIMDDIRQKSIFRDSPGGLIFMNELTDQAVRIDYLSVSRESGGTYAMRESAAGAVPPSPSENRKACVTDPYDVNCIRLVRARICDPGISATCQPMKLNLLTSFFHVELSLPISQTIKKAQSFGTFPN